MFDNNLVLWIIGAVAGVLYLLKRRARLHAEEE